MLVGERHQRQGSGRDCFEALAEAGAYRPDRRSSGSRYQDSAGVKFYGRRGLLLVVQSIGTDRERNSPREPTDRQGDAIRDRGDSGARQSIRNDYNQWEHKSEPMT